MEEILAQTLTPVRGVEDVPTVTPVEDIPVVKPVRDLPREARPTPREQKAGMGCAAQLFIAVLLIGVTASALLGAAWLAGLIDLNKLAGLANLGGNARERELDDLLKAKGAQTGEVQISLLWFNKNDLDLEVVAPSGETINFLKRESKCGGKLDVDMNVVYANASDRAVENVFWPQGKAPKGRYQVYVNHFQNHNQPDTRDPTRFSVRVLVRGEPHWYHGEVIHTDPKKQRVLVNEFDVK